MGTTHRLSLDAQGNELLTSEGVSIGGRMQDNVAPEGTDKSAQVSVLKAKADTVSTQGFVEIYEGDDKDVQTAKRHQNDIAAYNVTKQRIAIAEERGLPVPQALRDQLIRERIQAAISYGQCGGDISSLVED